MPGTGKAARLVALSQADPQLPMPTQPVRKVVSYRELFTAGWFRVREKHCFRLEIYDRLGASEQATVDQSAASCCLMANVESVLVRVLCWNFFYFFPFALSSRLVS